ncbi:MAG: hypothetical protein KDD82_00855 [Planctomycetes bacterium]|nr:hypothetical protein [Planctomycetota bacterium]
MRISLLEKLVLVLTVLSVLAVAAVVGFLMINVGLRSVVSDETEVAIQGTIEWLEAERERVNGRSAPKSIYVQPEAVQPGAAVATTADGRPKLKPASEVKYFEKREDNDPPPPPDEVVFPEYPWIKKQPGVVFVEPKRIAPVVYEKYQNFENAWGEAQSGWGEMSTTSNGEPAYEVKGFDPSSRMAKLLKLQPGDKVISVNGYPIGSDIASGKALYDQLRNEKNFSVLIERNNQRTVLSFTVR